MKFKAVTFAGIAMLGVSSVALASPYVSVSAGKVDHGDFVDFDNPFGFEVSLGHQFHENVALEVSYVNFGDAKDGVDPEWTVSADSVAVGLKLMAPASEQLKLYARLGMHSWEAEVEEEGFGKIDEDDGSDFYYGFGGDYAISDAVSLGARYTLYEFGLEGFHNQSSVFALNLEYSF